MLHFSRKASLIFFVTGSSSLSAHLNSCSIFIPNSASIRLSSVPSVVNVDLPFGSAPLGFFSSLFSEFNTAERNSSLHMDRRVDAVHA